MTKKPLPSSPAAADQRAAKGGKRKGSIPKGAAASSSGVDQVGGAPETHPESHLVRADVLARLKSMLGAEDPLPAPTGKTGVRPVVLALDPVLYAYYEEEAVRRNQLIPTGRFNTKSSAHGLLLEALVFRVPEVPLYRAAAAKIAQRRAALGLHPVTIRVPLPLHRDLERLAASVPGGRAMAVKSIGEALALIWAISVNVENLMPLKEDSTDAESARTAPVPSPRAGRPGSGGRD